MEGLKSNFFFIGKKRQMSKDIFLKNYTNILRCVSPKDIIKKQTLENSRGVLYDMKIYQIYRNANISKPIHTLIALLPCLANFGIWIHCSQKVTAVESQPLDLINSF
jgi:hypothetical protein